MQNLSNVTRAIIALIEAELARRSGGTPTFTVLSTPPSTNDSGAFVHVYLYHVKECPHNKNLPAPGGAGPIPIQHTPLVVVLQYVVTAVHGGQQDDNSPFDEQDHIGFVARAIHDYPLLTDQTVLSDGTLVGDRLDPGSELELIIRPAPPEETLSFYSAGQQTGVRLSLFVEARAAIIDPEPPETTLPGIVLSLGTVVAPMNLATLVSTHSQLALLRQGGLLTVNANPGRVAAFRFEDVRYTPAELAANPSPPARPFIDSRFLANARLVIETSGKLGGDVELLLEGNGSRVRTPLASGQGAGRNAHFNFQQGPKSLSLDLFTSLSGFVDDEPNTLRLFDIAPGLHSAALLVRSLDGTIRTTNKVAFFVMPHIFSLTAAGNQFALRISGNYLLQIHKSETEIGLSIGTNALRRRPASLPEANWGWTYTITADTITFALPPAQIDRPRGVQPVQLLVNGVPALPYYWEIPEA